MKLRRLKRLLAFAAIVTTLCTSTAFSSSAATITEEDTIVNHTAESVQGEDSLLDKEQLTIADEKQEGSITVQLTDGKTGTSKAGVKIYCTKVADVVDGAYQLLDTWKNTGVDLNAVANADDLKSAAEKLVSKAKENGKSEETNQDGQLVFTDLKVGVYLIQADNTGNYDTVEPALIAIPTWSDTEKDMLYDVSIEPKHSPKPGTLKVSAPKYKSSAPQTGLQDNTILYLAGAAGCMAVAGILVVGRKKKEKDGR